MSQPDANAGSEGGVKPPDPGVKPPDPSAKAPAPAQPAPTSEFKRDMGFWGNLALGFTYLSPVVGVYTTMATGLGIAGPPAFWMLLFAGLGQLLVATVFGEVVSQYPIAGGVYPWNRRLWGPKWGWMSGWIYMISINATIASVAYGAGPFLGSLVGIKVGPVANVLLALAVILVATLVNMGGTKLLSNVAFAGFVVEIIATIAIGAWLLIAAREHDLSVLFTDFRSAGDKATSPFLGAFIGSSVFGIFLYYGFEANGDVAEEVKDPGRVIPKAMRTTIYVGGVAAMFIALGLILAVPDFGAVLDGTATDPVGAVLLATFGPVGFRVVLALVLVSFLSCIISLQAAASRLMYSMGRDRQLPGSRFFGAFSKSRGVPPYALLAAALIPAIFVLISLFSDDALVAIISFASFGIYLAFGSVVLSALRARIKGRKPAGAFSMGNWGWVVIILALCYQLFAAYTLIQPESGVAWYQAWIVLIVAVIVVGLGLLYLFIGKPHVEEEGGYATPIAETEEIVDMAVRLDGGTPTTYDDRQGE